MCFFENDSSLHRHKLVHIKNKSNTKMHTNLLLGLGNMFPGQRKSAPYFHQVVQSLSFFVGGWGVGRGVHLDAERMAHHLVFIEL
jgi:hypothetical protein